MTGHIFIYGEIGTGNGQVSVSNIKSQIEHYKDASEYEVHIISNGGDVFEGFGIYNLLKNSGKKITTKVEGLCASIATLIAGAGEQIIMNRTSEFMIHNPHISDLNGDANQLRSAADRLDKIKTLLIDVYERKTGMPKDKLWELYDNETWLTAQEAQSMGFVDDVQDAIKAVAKVDLKKFKMETKKQSWVDSVLKNLFGLEKIKNQFTETLQDGTKIIVMSDDENWTGKPVAYETGEPVPAGEHVLASGKSIVVDESSTIIDVKEAAAPEDNQQNEEMENKVKELEAQLAEAKDALAKAQTQTSDAEAKAAAAISNSAKFQNKLTELEGSFLKFKEEMSKTVGDQSNQFLKGPVFKNSKGEDQLYDPMAEDLGQAYITSRPNSNYKR